MSTQTITLAQLPAVATQLLTDLARQVGNQAMVVGLSGNLGAGKTTFVQALAAELGVAERVQSPTFVVMKQYETTHPIFTQLVHMDAYRIEDVDELAPLHFAAVLAQPQTLVCIEWPEHIAAALPATTPQLTLSVVDEETREITFSGLVLNIT